MSRNILTTFAWSMTLISPSFRYSILSRLYYVFKRQSVSIKSWHLCSKQVFIHSVGRKFTKVTNWQRQQLTRHLPLLLSCCVTSCKRKSSMHDTNPFSPPLQNVLTFLFIFHLFSLCNFFTVSEHLCMTFSRRE